MVCFSVCMNEDSIKLFFQRSPSKIRVYCNNGSQSLVHGPLGGLQSHKKCEKAGKKVII